MIVDAVRAPTPAALVAALERVGAPEWAFADLSLGTWRAHQIATELAAQLGIGAGARPARFAYPSIGTLDYGGFVSDGVDADARGNRVVLDALARAEAVAAAIASGRGAGVAVLAPRAGIPWHDTDVAFLRLLGARVGGGPLVIAFCDDRPDADVPGCELRWLPAAPALPEQAVAASTSLVALVPGLVDAEVVEALGGIEPASLHPVSGGRFLVAADARPEPGAVSPLQYDKLHAAAHAAGLRELEAYAQYRGNNCFVDPHALAAQAWERFHEGDGDLALRLMVRATGCAAWPQTQWFEVQLQGMRLGLDRHADAASADDPSPAFDPAVGAFLAGAKGWGLTFGPDPGAALPYLREARAVLGPDDGLLEHMYLLNISALAELKSGDIDGAFALESEIERLLPTLPVADFALAYVNAVNISRLHTRSGNLNAARRYLERALSTTRNLRSTSEAIFANVAAARLDARADRPHDALLGWLRAALHWLAADTPETLSARVATTLLGRATAPHEDVIAPVSQALLRKLEELGDAAGVALDDVDTAAPPAFRRADRMAAAGTWRWATGDGGWSVVGCAPPARPPADRGVAYDALRAHVRALLVANAADDEELRVATALAIDDRCGSEVARTPLELLETCVRLGVPMLRLGSIRIDLDDELRGALAAHCVVRVAPSIAAVEDGRVRFRRSLAPRELATQEQAVVERCAPRDGVTLGSLVAAATMPPDEAVAVIRGLEDARILTTTITEATCSAAGLRLPTSTSLSAS